MPTVKRLAYRDKIETDRYTLYLGDCLDVLPTLQAGSVDAVVTDPPYGIGLRNGDVDGHRSERSFEIAGDDSQQVGIAIIKWTAQQKLPLVVFASPWKPWPISSRNMIVWDKGGAVGGGGDIATCLKRSWELIQTCRTGPMNGDRAESVWRFPINAQATVDHIASKPPALMIALVDRFTSCGDIVLDPFMGSGTTGVACMKLGRKFIGVEIDEGYFAIAAKRIQEARDEVLEYRETESYKIRKAGGLPLRYPDD